MKTSIEAVIEDVIIDPEKIQPIIVNFQNGDLKDDEAKKIKCGIYRDEKKNKTVLAMSNGQCVYKGYRPDIEKELTYTMLAVFNKKTGKIRLVQAERWDVAPVLDERIDDLNGEDVDMYAELNKQYASKKVKRKTEQYEKMKTNVEADKEMYEQTVENANIEKVSLESVAKDAFFEGLHIPACNREAKHVSEVYNIQDIVPENILTLLSEQVAEINEDTIVNKTPFFVKTYETFIKNSESDSKLALLIYMEAVAAWLSLPMKGARKDFLACGYPEQVSEYVMNTYSVASATGRLRPNTMKDKGIIHCIILGLTIWNFSLDLELFSTMFKIRLSVKKLLELSRIICAVPHKEDKKMVILKLPLPAEVPKVLTRKKKLNR